MNLVAHQHVLAKRLVRRIDVTNKQHSVAEIFQPGGRQHSQTHVFIAFCKLPDPRAAQPDMILELCAGRGNTFWYSFCLCPDALIPVSHFYKLYRYALISLYLMPLYLTSIFGFHHAVSFPAKQYFFQNPFHEGHKNRGFLFSNSSQIWTIEKDIANCLLQYSVYRILHMCSKGTCQTINIEQAN